MTSLKKIEANRRNSRKSCGPRTAAGKTTASRNALRHGLAAESHRPQSSASIEHFTRTLCGDIRDNALLLAATAIAKTEFALQKVSAQRTVVNETRLTESEVGGQIDHDEVNGLARCTERMAGIIDEEYASLERLIPELIRLDRYERRAWSRQKRAIRDYIKVKTLRT